MPPRGGKIKRTKTFTGCSTCRSRGVKCGEEKPTCLRCKKLSLDCGGYGVSLVWPNSAVQKTPQRRVILTGHESSVQALSEEKISSILDTIDAVTPCANLFVGLFGVFPASATPNSGFGETEHSSTTVPLLDPSTENRTRTDPPFPKPSQSLSHNELSDVEVKQRRRRNITWLEKLKWRLGLSFLEPSLYESMPISSKEGRQLMLYWASHLVPLMIPTERLDYPFTSIIVPLALSATDEPRESSGRRALLYAPLQLQLLPTPSRDAELTLGSKYLQLAIKQLGSSLVKTNYEAPEAVLATILTLTVIGIFTDNYSNYRAHIRGGVGWIRSIDKSTWKRNRDASAIYQIFTCVEALRPAHSLLARDLEPQDLSLEDLSEETNDKDGRLIESGFIPEYDTSLAESAYYCLDKVFCLTKPILECIMQINRLIFDDAPPVDGEIVALEFKLMMNNPESLHFPDLDVVSEKASHHHACILYNATYIYFKCSLLKLPSNSVGLLVQQSIEHFEAAELLAAGLNVSGLLWPLFITGCEADNGELRARISRIFDKRETLGIANVTTARKVVIEVWRRRDRGESDVSWHEVMAELDIDILLS